MEESESVEASDDRLRFLCASKAFDLGGGDREGEGDFRLLFGAGDLDMLRDLSLRRSGDFERLLDCILLFDPLIGCTGDGDRDRLVDIVETETEDTEPDLDFTLFPACS